MADESQKYKMKCMNHKCLFEWETYHPEYSDNRVCRRCGNMNIRKTEVN